MATKDQKINPDLRSLAEETLDLWQDYLDSYASDPKAKAELSQMMAPMNQMFAPWAELLQRGTNGTKPNAESSVAGEGKTGPTAGRAASDPASLERRMAELESRLAELESALAKALGKQVS